jgi:hypothetical protein
LPSWAFIPARAVVAARICRASVVRVASRVWRAAVSVVSSRVWRTSVVVVASRVRGTGVGVIPSRIRPALGRGTGTKRPAPTGGSAAAIGRPKRRPVVAPGTVVTRTFAVFFSVGAHGAEGACVAGDSDLVGARGLGGEDDNGGKLFRAGIRDHVLKPRRHEHRVHGLKRFDLNADAETGFALGDHQEGIGAIEGAARFLLLRLEAQKIDDEARPVEEINVHRPLPEESPGATDVDYVHGLPSRGRWCAGLREDLTHL